VFATAADGTLAVLEGGPRFGVELGVERFSMADGSPRPPIGDVPVSVFSSAESITIVGLDRGVVISSEDGPGTPGGPGRGLVTYYDPAGGITSRFGTSIPQGSATAPTTTSLSSGPGGGGLVSQGGLGSFDCGQAGADRTSWSLAQVRPTGVTWSFESPSAQVNCSNPGLFSVRSLPDGGTVVTADPSGSYGHALSVFDNTGRLRWSHIIDNLNPAFSGEDTNKLVVTADGEILLWQQASEVCVDNPASVCSAPTVRFFAASDGSLSRPALTLHSHSTSFSGVVITNIVPDTDQLLVSASNETDGGTYLSAFSIPGLARDYETVLGEQPGTLVSPGSMPPPAEPSPTTELQTQTPEPQPAPQIPVVLVSGLKENTEQVLPELKAGSRIVRQATVCSQANDFAVLCQRLRDAGFPVYVIPSNSGKAGEAPALDNKGDIDENAQRLVTFIASHVLSEQRMAPLVVGHSMGGLIARVAISRKQAKTAGLFTIGTPHTGSFGADLIKGATILACPPGALGGLCREVKSRAVAFLKDTGARAVSGLTAAARTADNLTLAPPRVPTWVYAGTIVRDITPLLNPARIPDLTGYFLPNDAIVGRSSALGILANLGGRTEYDKELWHFRSFPVLNAAAQPNEFEDSDVADKVAAAAESIAPVAAASAAARSATARRAPAGSRAFAKAVAPPARTPAKRPRTLRTRTVLTTAVGGQTSGARPKAIHAAEQIYAAEPFDLVCQGSVVAATQIASKLFGAPAGALSCRTVAVRSPRRLRFVLASPTNSVRATVTRIGTRGTIELRSQSIMRRVRVRIGATTRRGPSGRSAATIPIPRARRGSSVTLHVTVAGRPYTGSLSLP